MKKNSLILAVLAAALSTATAVGAHSEPTQLETAKAWVTGWMQKVEPLDATIYYDDAQETPAERERRYDSIAEDVVTVVFDPAEKPLFKGDQGRLRTAAVVLGIMAHESHFLKHIDYGIGKYARGDHGKSWCLMQVTTSNGQTAFPWNFAANRVPQPEDPPEAVRNITGEDMVSDRQLCIRMGLRIIRASFGECHENKLEERLASYASGHCDRGLDASRNRMQSALRMYASNTTARQAIRPQALITEVGELLADPVTGPPRESRVSLGLNN